MADNEHAVSQSEFRAVFEQEVRERAYYLWQKEGSPEGLGGDDYWHRALTECIRDHAFILWQQDGSPEGKEVEYAQKLRSILADINGPSDRDALGTRTGAGFPIA